MIIILETAVSLKSYLQEYAVKSPTEKRKCPICARSLRRHGRYFRSLVYGQVLQLLPVYRCLCPRCKKTFSLLPAFMRPYSHFGLCVREAAARLLASGGKVDVLAGRLCRSSSAGGVSVRTLRRWLRSWRQRARALAESIIEQVLHLAPGLDVTSYLPKPKCLRGWLLSVITLGEILRTLVCGAGVMPLFVFLNVHYPTHLSL